MRIEVDNIIGSLIHIYDYLNGGYFCAHHQLQYYNREAYKLCLDDNKKALIGMYDKLKDSVPSCVIEAIERSKGIRYFGCDGCHDAEVTNAYMLDDCLVLELDTIGMLGCLDIGDKCCLKIKTNSTITCNEIIEDVRTFKKMYWINLDIFFNDNCIEFTLELQTLTNAQCNNIKYTFVIDDIVIDEKE